MKKKALLIILLNSVLFFYSQSQGLNWVKSFEHANGYSIKVDRFGNSYTTGLFSGTTDFDPGIGTFDLVATGQSDLFVLKLDGAGNFVWAKNISEGGLTGLPVSYDVNLDSLGNIYITGQFSGPTDFDPSLDTFNLSGFMDIFILKLDNSGNFQWVKQIGSTNDDTGYAISLDLNNNIYISGTFQYTCDFDPGPATFNLSANGDHDIFVLKLNPSGNFVWAKNIGAGSSVSKGYSIISDKLGNSYTTGVFSGTIDFNPGSGVFNLNSAGNEDMFILKLDQYGNFVWACKMGSINIDRGYSLALDNNNNIYTTGYFNETVDFNPGAGIFNLTTPTGTNAMFILKLSSSGSFIWAKKLGGDYQSPIALDSAGNIYTTGVLWRTEDFDPGSGVFNLTSNGYHDIFISKLDNFGNFMWAYNIGDTLEDYGHSITADVAGNIYVTGYFKGVANFDPSGVFNLTSNGTSSMFVLKLGQNPIGILENNIENNINIYPNPFNGIFNITNTLPSKNASVEIYNSVGLLVLNQKYTTENNTIDLSNQSNGLYFVKVTSDNKTSTQKIIKQ